MYRYEPEDKAIVAARVAQFADQTNRYLGVWAAEGRGGLV